MKSQINKFKHKVALVLMLCCSDSTASFAGVQVDPALTSAITLQMNTLKNIYSKRENTQKQIIEAEAAVTLALDRMHKVESKVLDYMSNVQGAFQNLYQIKRAGELVMKDIPSNMNNVRRAIKVGGFQGYLPRYDRWRPAQQYDNGHDEPLSFLEAARDQWDIQHHRLR
jgi:hypothetical protein